MQTLLLKSLGIIHQARIGKSKRFGDILLMLVLVRRTVVVIGYRRVDTRYLDVGEIETGGTVREIALVCILITGPICPCGSTSSYLQTATTGDRRASLVNWLLLSRN
jgi:hypothetical protein